MIEQSAASYLDELNDVQRQAVTHETGPLQIIAGPGSGKTRVLTYRISHLINSGVKPWRILALTFTNKAAREMRERIDTVVPGGANGMWAGTFHSLFARLLRVHADRLGYPNNFSIYDTQDSRSVVKQILREEQLDPKVYNVAAVAGRISTAKTRMLSPEAYQLNTELKEYDKQSRRPLIGMIYEKYVNRCKRAGAMDFDDLLLKMYELLVKHEEAAEQIRSKFDHILVDEFQDTNHLQYEIVKRLIKYPESKENICIVGDDAQSIYAFRGATIKNILDFQRDFPDTTVFKLEQNYRSTHHIVAAANTIIKNNRRQIEKKIFTDKNIDDAEKINIVKTMTDQEEAKRVAGLIAEQKHRYHLANTDIAILYRTNSQSRLFEEHLRKNNIPYRVYGGMSFYQRKEVKDVIAYLRVIVNPTDEEALRRVINYPKRGIGQTTIDKVSMIADRMNRPMWDAMMTADLGRATAKIRDFVKLIKGLQSVLTTSNAHELAERVVQASTMLSTLKSDTTIEGMGRLENVVALLDGIKDFVEQDDVAYVEGDDPSDRSLAAYLQSIALLTDADEEKKDTPTVTLMSVHAAKGLEFKSVFVTGLEENLFPSGMALQERNGLDEERRLFYVAITRAERFLTLTYSKSRYKFGNMQMSSPSRFVSEISDENIAASANSSSRVKSGISGMPKRKVLRGGGAFKAAFTPPKDFKASPVSAIQVGCKIIHPKFGEGKVQSLDGSPENRIATIHFQDLGQKKIMLRFSKMMVVE